MSHIPLVLVVDKIYSSGMIMTKRLSSFGYRSELFNSPDDLIDYLKPVGHVPDLILVNLSSPSEALLSLPRKVKEEAPWADSVPFAVISALHEREFVVQTFSNGYLDYIVRPVEQEIFRDRIDKLLKKSLALSDVTYRKPMTEEAQLNIPMTIRQINEFGLSITCQSPLPVNSILRIQSPTFDKIFAEPVRVRVVSSRSISTSEHEAVLTFVGLEAPQIRALRQFAMTA